MTFFSAVVIPLILSGGTPVAKPATIPLAEKELNLDNRYSNSFVNGVFKDNILLTVNYATNNNINPRNIDWKMINSQYKGTVSLEPGQTFAFHDDVLPLYEGKISKTTNAHFNSKEGFKSDGYLVGDGVCHLASILYWVAKDAGLNTLAPTRHDFASIPDVPREYGVSIYDNSYSKNLSDEKQNLYITNNKDRTVIFVFSYDGKSLRVRAEEII